MRDKRFWTPVSASRKQGVKTDQHADEFLPVGVVRNRPHPLICSLLESS